MSICAHISCYPIQHHLNNQAQIRSLIAQYVVVPWGIEVFTSMLSKE